MLIFYQTVAKILNGDLLKDFSGQFSVHNFGMGPSGNTLAGFPHFKKVEFEGEFPIARLTFSDEAFPGKVYIHENVMKQGLNTSGRRILHSGAEHHRFFSLL